MEIIFKYKLKDQIASENIPNPWAAGEKILFELKFGNNNKRNSIIEKLFPIFNENDLKTKYAYKKFTLTIINK